MDFARQQRDPTRHLLGIAFVIVFHALIIYGLVTGLARKAVEVIKKPLNATIVEEVKLPPPPPPKKVELPKLPPPPPAYVPPPDIPVAVAPTGPTITVVTQAPPAPAAPPPVAVVAPPPPPPPPKPAIVRNPTPLGDCAPSMPPEATRKNIEGTVVAHMMVDEKGNVTEVKIVKADPPRVFDRHVISALSQCKFQASGDKWVGEQEIEFKLQ